MTSDKLESASPEAIREFYHQCGYDGLNAQAFYSSSSNKFIICPGWLLQMLNHGAGADGLDMVVGHELGHAVDPGRDVLPKLSKQDFVACLRSNKNLSLQNPPDTSSFYAKNLDALKRVRDQLKRKLQLTTNLMEYNKVYDQYVNVTRSVSTMSNASGEFNGEVGTLAAQVGPPVDGALTHSGELFADSVASGTIAQSVAHVHGKDHRANMVKNALVELCGDPAKDASDDGLHPPISERFKMILSNGKLRKELGCKSDPPFHWCGEK